MHDSIPLQSTPLVLEVAGVSKAFNGFQAVSDVSVALRHGTLTAVIGPNGAGKSTLFNLITGHYVPDSGEIVFNGAKVTALPPHRLSTLGMGRSFQRANVFARLTVFENVQAALIAHRGLGRKLFVPSRDFVRPETRDILAATGLSARADETAGALSYGDQKQLELGIALAAEPTLLLLDEPTADMSARETRESVALIERIVRDHAITLLFTEHDMETVFSIAERIVVLHQGKVIADGDPATIRSDRAVRRVYLGEKF
jgi:branched-chain amino acid transport system ATP-binding protein